VGLFSGEPDADVNARSLRERSWEGKRWWKPAPPQRLTGGRLTNTQPNSLLLGPGEKEGGDAGGKKKQEVRYEHEAPSPEDRRHFYGAEFKEGEGIPKGITRGAGKEWETGGIGDEKKRISPLRGRSRNLRVEG